MVLHRTRRYLSGVRHRERSDLIHSAFVVDVGARSEIHRIINELAERGAAILVISSDDEELPGLCDRVMVMAEGRIAGELRGVEITREAILRLSYHSTI